MESAPTWPRAPRSLSRRLLWLTSAVVLLIEVLIFVPAITEARRAWLHSRITDAQLAALAAGAGPTDREAAENLLNLAAIASVRMLAAGSGPVTVGSLGALQASHLIDLRTETWPQAFAEAIGALVDGSDRLILVEATGQGRHPVILSVVFRGAALSQRLRGVAQQVALLALLVAAMTGLFVSVTLRILLVRPMRRLTASIAAFRADPERTPPLEAERLTPLPDDEVAVAGRELADMQRELRAALWRNARLVALGTAVAKVSHDLRGILSPALLSAERLQSHADPSVKRVGDAIVRAVERATELVRSGLEFAREGPVTLTRSRFSLAAVVTEATEQVAPVVPELRIENAVPEDVTLDADRELMVRVLANLLRNAGEAAAAHVVVEARQEGYDTVITVADDGPGLPPRVQAALFKPFVVGARKGSTGLGLAIARDLMRAHLGDIALLRTGPTGTAFRLTLPTPLSRGTARPVQAQTA